MWDFKRLEVWKRARELAATIARATRSLPRPDSLVFQVQMRRAANSICDNIAEACGRRTQAEFAQFLSVAMGSAKEVESQLLLAADQGLLQDESDRCLDLVTQVQKMLVALIKRSYRS